MPEVDSELLAALRKDFQSGTIRPLLELADGYSTEALIRTFSKGREELAQIISSLDDVQVGFQPAPGAFSVNEVVTHMIASQGGVYNALLDLSQLVLPMIGNVAHGPGGGAQNNLTTTEASRQLREATEEISFLIREVARIEKPIIRTYERFGEMSAKSWILFMIAHDNDHLNQAREVVGSANFPMRNSQVPEQA